MNVNWYNLFSKPDFEATGLVQRIINASLNEIGDKEIIISKGNLLTVLYDGVLLPVNFQDQNPFTPDDTHYVYIDDDQNVWLGVAIA